MKPTKALAVLPAVLVSIIVGCGGGANESAAVEATAPAATTRDHRVGRSRDEPAAGADHAARLLRSIKVAPEASAARYSRAAFPHWLEQDGCSTRQDVLIQERRRGAAAECRVKDGKWFSVYDGTTFTDTSRMDIDHFVPLEQAYVSGARRWNLATRTDFANDLGYIGSLIAVSAASNRSKGARDPSEWMPPRTAFRCRYIGTWIAVKYRWRLTADRAEFMVLRRWVKQCGSSANVRKPKRARIEFGGNGRSEPRAQGPERVHKGADPRFETCKDAKAQGYGPYRRGVDPEYAWYRDSDGDGVDCE